MNDARISAFWNSYFKLDELKKRALLLQLTGINKLNVTLMQSYFDDLEQKARADEREKIIKMLNTTIRRELSYEFLRTMSSENKNDILDFVIQYFQEALAPGEKG